MSAAAVSRALRIAPRPLLHPDARMLVIFSPKSACTNVVIWFLHQLGHAKAAFDFDPWPHQYRAEVYFKSKLYQRACALDVAQFAVVRVVRDPFSRAASSFRHALQRGLVDPDFSMLPEPARAADQGLSFAEFLDCLDRLDLTTCNPHYRIQRHPIEDLLPVRYLINVSTEDLFTRLNEVETDLGLPLTDFVEVPWFHRDRRSSVNGTLDTADAYTLPLTQSAARKGPWPRYEALLSPSARERIARLYAVDLASYAPKPAGLAPSRQ
jgi:hypothetical protein